VNIVSYEGLNCIGIIILTIKHTTIWICDSKKESAFCIQLKKKNTIRAYTDLPETDRLQNKVIVCFIAISIASLSMACHDIH